MQLAKQRLVIVSKQFEQYKDEYKITETDFITGKGEVRKSDYNLRKKLNDSLISIQFTKNVKKIEELKKEIYFNNSPLYILKRYFPNGNIKLKVISFVGGSSIGIWYEFDEAGNLIKTKLPSFHWTKN